MKQVNKSCFAKICNKPIWGISGGRQLPRRLLYLGYSFEIWGLMYIKGQTDKTMRYQGLENLTPQSMRLFENTSTVFVEAFQVKVMGETWHVCLLCSILFKEGPRHGRSSSFILRLLRSRRPRDNAKVKRRIARGSAITRRNWTFHMYIHMYACIYISGVLYIRGQRIQVCPMQGCLHIRVHIGDPLHKCSFYMWLPLLTLDTFWTPSGHPV